DTRPRVSVLVRAPSLQRLEVFLGTMESTSYQPRRAFPTYVTYADGGFAYPSRLRTPPGIAIAPVGLSSCVTPSLHDGGAGILTCCPSTTPFGLALGPA